MSKNIFFEEVKKSIFNVIDEEIDDNLIEIPSDNSLGDYAFPCFFLAKKFKKAPNMIANDLIEKLQFDKNIISSVKATGAYINFFLNKTTFTKNTLQNVNEKKEKFGSQENKNQTILIESPGPNTNKPLHLGHVRNMLIGNSIQNIYHFLGYKTVRIDMVNDRGIHICKSMLAYKMFGNNSKPNKKPDHYVGDYYVKYAQESKNHPKMEEDIKIMLRDWENNEPETRKLWMKMRNWVLDGINKTYIRYGVKMDKPYYESNHYDRGKEAVKEGLKKGIFNKDESGNLYYSDEDIEKKIILRADGTSIYITQDIILGKIRYDDYKFDKMIYIVASEQIHHFKCLFNIFGALGYPFSKKCYHLPYGMIYLPEGKMKSREGTVVDADNLADDMHQESKKEILARHPDINKEELEDRSEKIGMSAIKYFILKYDALKDFVFNPKESLAFEGETGPYIQYTYARIASILRKYGKDIPDEIDYKLIDDAFHIIRMLSEFPDIVKNSGLDYKPNYITRYLADLCKMFGEYYHNNKILCDDKKLEKARLHLIKQVQQVIKIGLSLLGIDAIEEM